MRSGPRYWAAAVALGLALAGPQAAGVAAAEAPDSGSSTSVSSHGSGAAKPGTRGAAAIRRTVRVAPTAGINRVKAVNSSPGVGNRPSNPVRPLQPFLEGVGLLARRFIGGTPSVDINYESHVNESGTVIRHRLIPSEGANPADYADVLKFSNCTDVVVDGSTVVGGKEDAIDAVRGSNYTFRNLTLVPNANGITAKGSIDGVLIENVSITAHGTDSDLEFGQFDNYWYVGRPPTQNITIKNVNAVDGQPVVVTLWDATTPTVIDSNVTIIRVPKWIWWPYFAIRAIQTRGIAGLFRPPGS